MPWLAVAVYVRAPVADAPMQTDIAANSDSTLMNSHGVSAPVFTSALSPSTMCVCGEIGYAPITSGRHKATVSATAREPSIWLGMRVHLRKGRTGGVDVAGRDRGREAFLDRLRQRIEADDAGGCGERGKQRRARHRT